MSVVTKLKLDTSVLPSIDLYIKLSGCAGGRKWATVKICVTFNSFNASMFWATPTEPRKSPCVIIKKILVSQIYETLYKNGSVPMSINTNRKSSAQCTNRQFNEVEGFIYHV